MAGTTYYAGLPIGSTIEKPAGIFRRTHTEPYPTDEVFARDRAWHPTASISMHFMNQLDYDLQEITEAAAMAVIDGWTSKWDREA